MKVQGLITTIAANEAYEALVARGFEIYETPYQWLGFYLKDPYDRGQPHTKPAPEAGIWWQQVEGGYEFTFKIYRTPLLNPTSPQPATVDWQITHGVLTQSSSYPYNWSFSSVTIASGTESFAANETEKTVTVQSEVSLTPYENNGSSAHDIIYVTLSNPVNELLGYGRDSIQVTPSYGDTLVAHYADQRGFFLPYITGWELKQARLTVNGVLLQFQVHRKPALDPGSPEPATVEWTLETTLAPYPSYWSDNVWTLFDSGVVSFTATDTIKTVAIEYTDPYTAGPNTFFRFRLHEPVNELLGNAEVVAFVPANVS